MNRRVWHIAGLALVLAAGLIYFSFLGDMPLTDRDEGEYASVVAAMTASGDYVVPTMNGRLYLEKPILIYWAMAGAQALFGENELGARLPSALSAFLLVILTALTVMRVSGSPALAVLSAGALAFTPLMVLVGRACLTDQLLTLFTTSSLFLFFLASETPPPDDRRWFLLAWAALGLGFLTKGPVAPAVVLPAALIYSLWQRDLKHILKRSQIHWGLVIFIGINLPWYGLAFYQLGGQFWDSFFMAQNVRRFSEVLLGHGGGFLYYLPVLLAGAFPFVAAALPALIRALFKNPAQARQADASARLRLFAAIAALWSLVVFSLAATKQINYILPAFPFMAILAGYFLWRLGSGEDPGRWARWLFWGVLGLGGLVWFSALAGVPVGLKLFWPAIQGSIRPDSSEYALPASAPLLVMWPLLCALAAAGILVLTWYLHKRGLNKWLGLGLSAAGAVICAALFLGLMGQAAGIIQEPAKQMGLAVKDKAPPESKAATFGLWKPSLFYYSGRSLPHIRVNEVDRLKALLSGPEPALVMSRTLLLPELNKVPGFHELQAFEGYLLGGNQAALDKWQVSAPSKAGEAGS